MGSRPLSGLRFGASPAFPGAKIAKSVRQQVSRIAAQAEVAGACVEEGLPEVDWDALHSLFQDLLMTITSIFSHESNLRDEQRALTWYFGALDRRDRFITLWEKY